MMSFVKKLVVTGVMLVAWIYVGLMLTNSGRFASESNSSTKQSEAKFQSYIVQGTAADRLQLLVEDAGGTVTRELPIINAISASMTPSQAEKLKQSSNVRVSDDRVVRTMSSLYTFSTSRSLGSDSSVTKQVKANQVHNLGITGRGVTVAIIDSGTNMGGEIGQYLFKDAFGRPRVFVKYDALQGTESYFYNDDYNGHGTHVTGIIASSLRDSSGIFNGVAPDVFLLSIKAFDENGFSHYSAILDALNWVLENKVRFRIRVLNMSLGADAQSRYWDDPINQAVMRLWAEGVTVVTSAGNNGTELGITVPGNTPYVITVGATTGSSTPAVLSDDRVASFSSQGPTYEGFVKPDIVAPGAQIGVKLDQRLLVDSLPLHESGNGYSVISGTSQSSAVVTGLAALIIQANPNISPDDVKCKIISSAKVAYNDDQYVYSPLIQGSGMVDAFEAVTSNASNCANQGLDIHADLRGNGNFYGPVNKSGDLYTIDLANGNVLVEGSHWGGDVALNGAHWSAAVIKIEGSHWGSGRVGLSGSHWSLESVELIGSHWGSNFDGVGLLSIDTKAETEAFTGSIQTPQIESSAWQ